MTKSGKSTVSFTFLGRSYRFFAEIRRVKDRLRGPKFLSLKAASCLSEFTQTWRGKPAKPLRLGVLFRQIVQTWRENQARSRLTRNVALILSRSEHRHAKTRAVFPQLLSGARSFSAIAFELPADHPSNCKNVILDSTNQIYRLVSAQKMNEMIGSNSDTTQNQREQNRT